MRERITLETEQALLRAVSVYRNDDAARSFEGNVGTVETDPDSLKIPLRWICRIRLRGMFTSKVDQLASGVLIGPRHVLTSAHVLDPFYAASANQITSIDVMPGYSGTDRLGTYSMKNPKNLRVSANWRDKARRDADPDALSQDRSAGNDFGMIILNDDKISTERQKALKDRPLGHWGHPTLGNSTVFSKLPAAFLVEPAKPMHTAGYAHRQNKIWSGSGQVWNVQAKDRPRRAFTHSILTSLGTDARGMSGGPLWVKVDDTRYLTGINASVIEKTVQNVDEKSNKTTERKVWQATAARLGGDTFEEIMRWMKADP
jgi:hypothetical protein